MRLPRYMKTSTKPKVDGKRFLTRGNAAMLLSAPTKTGTGPFRAKVHNPNTNVANVPTRHLFRVQFNTHGNCVTMKSVVAVTNITVNAASGSITIPKSYKQQ